MQLAPLPPAFSDCKCEDCVFQDWQSAATDRFPGRSPTKIDRKLDQLICSYRLASRAKQSQIDRKLDQQIRCYRQGSRAEIRPKWIENWTGKSALPTGFPGRKKFKIDRTSDQQICSYQRGPRAESRPKRTEHWTSKSAAIDGAPGRKTDQN